MGPNSRHYRNNGRERWPDETRDLVVRSDLSQRDFALRNRGVGPDRESPEVCERDRRRGEQEAGRRQLAESGEVLDDRDARRKQDRVRGPASVTLNVVDVDRIDADQPGAASQPAPAAVRPLAGGCRGYDR